MKTYPQLRNHPLCLVAIDPTIPIICICADGVVGKRPGRLPHSGKVNKAREVCLAQKTKNAIGMASVTTCTHNHETPAQVIKKNY